MSLTTDGQKVHGFQSPAVDSQNDQTLQYSAHALSTVDSGTWSSIRLPVWTAALDNPWFLGRQIVTPTFKNFHLTLTLQSLPAMALCLYSPSLFSTQRFFLSSYTCSSSFTFFLSRLSPSHILVYSFSTSFPHLVLYLPPTLQQPFSLARPMSVSRWSLTPV